MIKYLSVEHIDLHLLKQRAKGQDICVVKIAPCFKGLLGDRPQDWALGFFGEHVGDLIQARHHFECSSGIVLHCLRDLLPGGVVKCLNPSLNHSASILEDGTDQELLISQDKKEEKKTVQLM